MITKQAKLKQKAYQSSLKSRALSVLIYLIDRSNKDLTCFPGHSNHGGAAPRFYFYGETRPA